MSISLFSIDSSGFGGRGGEFLLVVKGTLLYIFGTSLARWSLSFVHIYGLALFIVPLPYIHIYLSRMYMSFCASI